jgi:hypothetical protein
MASMGTIIAFSGPDNVGKSTQLRWLQRVLLDATSLGTIDQYDERWKQLANDDFSDWWFSKSSTREHTSLILQSHATRVRLAPGGLSLVDRGLPMLLAVCAATIALKEERDPEQAMEIVNELAQELLADKIRERRTVDLLLVPTLDVEGCVAVTVGREVDAVSERYRRYQTFLSKILLAQAQKGVYHEVIVCGKLSVCDVQNRIRRFVSLQLGRSLGELIETIDTVWALGGLSESGKSTVGSLLANSYGIRRLKIGYLLANAATRLGLPEPSVYDLTPQLLAEELVVELDQYALRHRDQRRYSIESIHRAAMTRELKKIMGAKLVITYIEAPFPLRLIRSGTSPESIAEKDQTKLTRGAAEVSTFADELVDNSGSMVSLEASVARMISRRYGRVKPLRCNPDDLSLSCDIKQWLRYLLAELTLKNELTLLMLALTGSGSTTEWLPGWSDLDVLAVCKPSDVEKIAAICGHMRLPSSEPKIAYTIVTPIEIDSLALSARVIHALRLIGEQRIPVLFANEDFMLPDLPVSADVEATRHDIPTVASVLRRLTIDPIFNIKAAYKHVILLAKLLLRLDGIHVETADQVLSSFNEHYPTNGIVLPSRSEVRDDYSKEAVQAVVRKAANRLLVSYTFLLAPTSGSGLIPTTVQ